MRKELTEYVAKHNYMTLSFRGDDPQVAEIVVRFEKPTVFAHVHNEFERLSKSIKGLIVPAPFVVMTLVSNKGFTAVIEHTNSPADVSSKLHRFACVRPGMFVQKGAELPNQGWTVVCPSNNEEYVADIRRDLKLYIEDLNCSISRGPNLTGAAQLYVHTTGGEGVEHDLSELLAQALHNFLKTKVGVEYWLEDSVQGWVIEYSTPLDLMGDNQAVFGYQGECLVKLRLVVDHYATVTRGGILDSTVRLNVQLRTEPPPSLGQLHARRNTLPPPPLPLLTFDYLRKVNAERCEAWNPDRTWEPADYMIELIGEVGEAANLLKKLKRIEDNLIGNHPDEETTLRAQLLDEIGDVQICLDLLANALGIDLAQVTRDKFNKTSDKVGLPHKL